MFIKLANKYEFAANAAKLVSSHTRESDRLNYFLLALSISFYFQTQFAGNLLEYLLYLFKRANRE